MWSNEFLIVRLFRGPTARVAQAEVNDIIRRNESSNDYAATFCLQIVNYNSFLDHLWSVRRIPGSYTGGLGEDRYQLLLRE